MHFLNKLLPSVKVSRRKTRKQKQQKLKEAKLGDSAKTLETAATGCSESSFTLSSTSWDLTEGSHALELLASIPVLKTRPIHPHRRSESLAQDDYDRLYVKSRGWMYDPKEPASKPQHLRRRALTDFDYDQFIFANSCTARMESTRFLMPQ